MRQVSKRDLLRRIEAVEDRLRSPTPKPIPGQHEIRIPTNKETPCPRPAPNAATPRSGTTKPTSR